jgi:hypothetical protein
MRDGGKGDRPRPIPSREKFEKNWDSIFKPKSRKTDDKKIPKGIK